MSRPLLSEFNLNLLLSLDALLQERNVTRAARRVGVSQSAMSRNLATLRSLFSDELLTRVGNDMRATPLAEELGPALGTCLTELERVVRTAGVFEPASARGTVRLAAPGHLGVWVAPALMRTFARDAPGLVLRVEQADDAQLGAAIAAGVDIALGPAIETSGALGSRVLFRDGFACLVRSEHPAARDGLDLETYLELSHIVISPTGRHGARVDEALRELGHRRHVAMWTQSFLLAPQTVAVTDHVLTAPRSVLLAAAKTMAVRLLEAPLELAPIRIAAYWDLRRSNDAQTMWLLEAVASAVQALRDPG